MKKKSVFAILLFAILLLIVVILACVQCVHADIYSDRNDIYREQVNEEIARRHELQMLELEHSIYADRIALEKDSINISQRSSSFSRSNSFADSKSFAFSRQSV